MHPVRIAAPLVVVHASLAGLAMVAVSWVIHQVGHSIGLDVLAGLAFVAGTAAAPVLLANAADRAALESTARMWHMIESGGDVAFRYRLAPYAGFDYVSDRIHDWVGFTPAEHYQHPDLAVALVHPDDRADFAEMLKLGTTSHSVPIRLVVSDGRVVHALVDTREVLDRRRRVVAIDGRVRNVTDQHRSQAESAIAEGILSGLAVAPDSESIAQHTCDQLVAQMEIDAAWIGVPLFDGSIRVIAAAGDHAILDHVGRRWDESCDDGLGPAGRALRERRAIATNLAAAGYAPWRHRSNELGASASLAVPLLLRNESVGVISVSTRLGDPFDHRYVDRFMRTAERLAVVMSAADRIADPTSAVRRSPAGGSFDLAKAIQHGRVEPWWQPQIDSLDGRVVAVEALARARTEDGDLVMPGTMFALAEERGLMVELGRVLRRQIIVEAPRWIALGIERIAINASVAELAEPGFAFELLHLVDGHRVSHDSIEIEIIETAPLDHPAVRALDELAAAGIRIAVDDYGSGWATLGHLAQLPATTLKIDRVFIHDIGTSARADQLVRNTIDLARNLGLRTVAEGVETLEQADALRSMGCDLLQGFLFAAPMETDAMRRHLLEASVGCPTQAHS